MSTWKIFINAVNVSVYRSCAFESADGLFVADVIHTVGPQGEHVGELQSCYKRCIKKMNENNLKSIVRLSELHETKTSWHSLSKVKVKVNRV